MTKSIIDDICKAMIAEINKKGFDFMYATKDCAHADCKFNDLPLVLDIIVEFDNDAITNVLFKLTVDKEQSDKLTLKELIDRLDMIKSYAKDSNEYYECCICGKLCKGYGNNPQPVKKSGKCCNECNEAVVIPARIKELSDGRD